MWKNFTGLFHFADAAEYLPDLFQAALVSIELTIDVMILALIAGLVLAIMRMSGSRWLRYLAVGYVEVIRGTPALLALFYIYFVLPSFGIRVPAFTAGVIGLAVSYAAYISEVYRAGIAAIATGQSEAALALGLSRWKAFRLVVLPQAIRIVVPPLGNYLIALFKDTALVSTITVRELMFTGQIIASTNFQYFTIFTLIGAMYLGMSLVASLGVRTLERRLAAHVDRRGVRTPNPPSVPDAEHI